MSIRIVDMCGTLPTSIREGSLIIHGADDVPVAAIPLPFKTKFNGPINREYIRYPNVAVFTHTDSGDIIVMRYDGTYTIYTPNFCIKFFGNYDKDLWKNYTYTDVFGCFSEVPIGYKKPRLYEAYILRFLDSDKLFYTCVGHPVVKQITGRIDERVEYLLTKGLAIGKIGWPCLTEFQEHLYENTEDILLPCIEPKLEEGILHQRLKDNANVQIGTWCQIYRRRSYAEVIMESVPRLQKLPNFLSEMIDTEYIESIARTDDDRPSYDVAYQMAMIMDAHPEYIVGTEINGHLAVFADDDGNIRGHDIYDLNLSAVDLKGSPGVMVGSRTTPYNLVGYANTPALQISIGRSLYRLPHRGGTIYVGKQSVQVPSTHVLSSVPDANMTGYRDCVDNNAKGVYYTEDGNPHFIIGG